MPFVTQRDRLRQPDTGRRIAHPVTSLHKSIEFETNFIYYIERYSKFQRNPGLVEQRNSIKLEGEITWLAFSWPILIKAVSAVLFLKNV